MDDPPAPFVVDGRLRSLPARQQRRREVLEHVATRAFAPDETYAEPEVDARLQRWCEGGEVDRVALRRYLVDAALLTRREGRYWRTTATTPPLGLAEQRVQDLGLA